MFGIGRIGAESRKHMQYSPPIFLLLFCCVHGFGVGDVPLSTWACTRYRVLSASVRCCLRHHSSCIGGGIEHRVYPNRQVSDVYVAIITDRKGIREGVLVIKARDDRDRPSSLF